MQKKIFNILKKLYPKRFRIHPDFLYDTQTDREFDIDSLEGAFYLAEQVRLFRDYSLILQQTDTSWYIDPYHEDGGPQIAEASTVPKVIQKTIINIFGEKE